MPFLLIPSSSFPSGEKAVRSTALSIRLTYLNGSFELRVASITLRSPAQHRGSAAIGEGLSAQIATGLEHVVAEPVERDGR